MTAIPNFSRIPTWNPWNPWKYGSGHMCRRYPKTETKKMTWTKTLTKILTMMMGVILRKSRQDGDRMRMRRTRRKRMRKRGVRKKSICLRGTSCPCPWGHPRPWRMAFAGERGHRQRDVLRDGVWRSRRNTSRAAESLPQRRIGGYRSKGGPNRERHAKNGHGQDGRRKRGRWRKRREKDDSDECGP
jgi:hypothetical protein